MGDGPCDLLARYRYRCVNCVDFQIGAAGVDDGVYAGVGAGGGVASISRTCWETESGLGTGLGLWRTASLGLFMLLTGNLKTFAVALAAATFVAVGLLAAVSLSDSLRTCRRLQIGHKQ